jgi:RND superfamily putative drug exporter
MRTSLTGRLAVAASRHPWRIVLAWLLLLTVAGVLATHIGDALTDQSDLAVQTEASRAADILQAHFGADPVRELVVVEAAHGGVGDQGFAENVASLEARLSDLDTVQSAVSYLDGVPGLLSSDGHTALISVTLVGAAKDAAANAAPIVELIEHAGAESGYRITTLGEGSVNAEFDALAEDTLVKGETVGLSIALVVLVLVFGAVIAAGIPLLLALASIVLAVGMTALVGHAFDLSFFVVNMISMIGLAVGVDYSLFIVQRFREERAKGRTIPDAVARAGETATRAVVFSGMTVVIALTGLLYMPETTMRSMGIGAILAVVAALAAATTLLPAMLRLLGDRVNRLRVPFTSRTHYTEGGGRFWRSVTRVVTSRPMVGAGLAIGLLLVLAIPYTSISTGSNFIASLPPDSGARHAYEIIESEFDTGVITTPIVLLGADEASVQTVADRIDRKVAEMPAFGDLQVRADGAVAVIDAIMKPDPSSDAAKDAVLNLRNVVLPETVEGTDVTALVGGDTAASIDYVDVLNARTPVIFAFVLGLSFVFLMIVFRSVVVPLKAIAMNLLSVGAAYGLLVLVFQKGIGADLFGFHTSDAIEAWVPLFLFTVLFGLSMDYHIFLLSRIKERYEATGDNTGSVAFGLGSTGAIITGAALIMVAVFGGFAIGDLVMFQQLGFGLAAAVILDATIVRSVLVPSTMELLGSRNWYLPRWLQWLPSVRVEGPDGGAVAPVGMQLGGGDV